VKGGMKRRLMAEKAIHLRVLLFLIIMIGKRKKSQVVMTKITKIRYEA
jgi:hypothetical protein